MTTLVKEYRNIPIEVDEKGIFSATVNGRKRSSIKLRDLELKIDKEVQGIPCVTFSGHNSWSPAPRPHTTLAIGATEDRWGNPEEVDTRDGKVRYGEPVYHADQSLIDGLNALADEQDACLKSVRERRDALLRQARRITSADFKGIIP